jgi:succinate-acetate transporter protein
LAACVSSSRGLWSLLPGIPYASIPTALFHHPILLPGETKEYLFQFGATVFPSYAAFNLSYALIYIPGSGILSAYTDATTGALRPEFNQALALYLWVWFIITVLYTVAAMRSTWVLFLDLLALSVCLLLLACGFMTGVEGLLTAGYAVGVVVCFLSCEFSLFFFS